MQDIQADFVMADGHKWMLGPEGLALFYCRKAHLETLQLKQYGWHMVEALGDYNRQQWQAAKSARRFECGSPNMLAIHALHASLSLLLEVGLKEVELMLAERVNHLIKKIKQHPQLELLSPETHHQRAGIVTFKHKTIVPEALYQTLMDNSVICAARGGGVRFSPHFYTPLEKIDEAFTRINGVIKGLE